MLKITLHMDFELHQTPLGPKEPPLSKEWAWLFFFEASPHKDTNQVQRKASVSKSSLKILNKTPETRKLKEV